MFRYELLILALIVAVSSPAFPAESAVRQIEIKSSWGGLGRPQNTELAVRHDNGEYRIGNMRIDPANVESLLASIRQPPQMKPTLENLGMSEQWLTNAADKLEKDAEHNDGGDSALYKLEHGSADQKGLFRRSYTDPNFMAKVLPEIFRCCHTDDYPGVKVTILYDDGSRTVISSHSQSEFMLPWKVEGGNATVETFNKNISVALAAIMPKKATNRERVSGQGLDLALAWVVMDAIEGDWNLSNVKVHASEALVKIGNVYKILSADINPYHDVTFGIYVKDGKGEGEENLHVDLSRHSFPAGFVVRAILLYKDNAVSGVDQFLQNVPRYEDLVLAVPWLARLRANQPRSGTTLLWIHDKSLSDKALKNFAADMHALGKDSLAEEVRQVQAQVAVVNVSYGDWWLVLPDRRMVLWQYESVMGLLGWKKSDFHKHDCTDYQGVTGGCVGAVVSSDGELTN
jgi:hypothetical protein